MGQTEYRPSTNRLTLLRAWLSMPHLPHLRRHLHNRSCCLNACLPHPPPPLITYIAHILLAIQMPQAHHSTAPAACLVLTDWLCTYQVERMKQQPALHEFALAATSLVCLQPPSAPSSVLPCRACTVPQYIWFSVAVPHKFHFQRLRTSPNKQQAQCQQKSAVQQA